MRNSGWTLLDSAEQIFKITRERIFNNKDGAFINYRLFLPCIENSLSLNISNRIRTRKMPQMAIIVRNFMRRNPE